MKTTKTVKAKKVTLDFVLSPTVDMSRFQYVFSVAKAKWPNVALCYIGTDVEGNHHFQERGGCVHILSAAEAR